jgi:hypothetical protein
VKKLMYLYWKLRLLDKMPLDVVDMCECELELGKDDGVVGSIRSAVVDEDDNEDEDNNKGDEYDDDENNDEGDEKDEEEIVRVAF